MTRRFGIISVLVLVVGASFGFRSGGTQLIPSAGGGGLVPPSQLPAGMAFELVWGDEFEGRTLDRSKWDHILGPRRDGFWVAEDAYLDGHGHLVLRTNKDRDRFTSGAVWTKPTFLHSFGYYEIRCQLPAREGHWPAFWIQSPTYGANIGDPATSGAEIDIMEYPWRDGTINHAVHWDGYAADHKTFVQKSMLDDPAGWHTFGLMWTESLYIFYVDGREVAQTTEGISKRPEYIEVTDEIGSWGGDIKKAALPDYFFVDYVRVFRIKKPG